VTFLSKFPGLDLVQQHQVEKAGVDILHRRFTQAAVSVSSPLLGKSVRDVRFREKYGAAVVAVHRQDERVALKVQDIALKARGARARTHTRSGGPPRLHTRAAHTHTRARARALAALLDCHAQVDLLALAASADAGDTS
jgi:hypothetical protein